MRIANIATELKFANRIGQTLAAEERIGLEVSVLRLAQEYACEGFLFWGRVEGVLKNYYIVAGVSLKGGEQFVSKKYFWR